MLKRRIKSEIMRALKRTPAVAILGPRQCGKSTLAQEICRELGATYLDLERPSDRQKISDPEIYFEDKAVKMVCLDEIQRLPEIFAPLRSILDQHKKNGQLLILGSASRELIRQSSESLAGRITYFELTPFTASEVNIESNAQLKKLWLRGGFPRSLLSKTMDESIEWRRSFTRDFLERDIPQLGFNLPAEAMRRLWTMCAHHQGGILNASALGHSMGLSHTTIRNYLGLLSDTYMLRLLPPLEANLKKRIVKSPKVYIRDSGILHSLLEIESFDSLLGNPIYGASWEGFVINQILAEIPAGVRASFYRTSGGAELDLIIEKGKRRIGIECKASKNPAVTRGFWESLKDLEISEAYIVAPIEEEYALTKEVRVCPLMTVLKRVLF